MNGWDIGGKGEAKGRGKDELTSSGSGIIIRKAVHDDGEEGPGEENVVGKGTESAEPEGSVSDVVAAAHEERDDGDGVGDVEEDDAGGYHAAGGGVSLSFSFVFFSLSLVEEPRKGGCRFRELRR
jgi:hypothetical protein